MKIAFGGVSTATGAVAVERVVLCVFAVITLLMPLLFLQANYFIVATALLLTCIVVARKYRTAGTYNRARMLITQHPGLVIFIVALVTRLLWVLVLSPHTKQVSDFMDVYSDSLQSVPTSRHVPIWTHFIAYPYLLHFLVNLFGPSTLVGGVFNAIVCSVSAVLTYLVGAAVANKKVGFVAAVIMLLWPGMAVFTSIYAPDHLSVCFTLLSIFCFIRLMQVKRTTTKIAFTVGCAMSLWALGFFKDLTPILVIAFIVAMALHLMQTGQLKGSLATVYCTLGLCAFALFGGVTHVPIISAMAHRPVNPSLVPYFVYTGLGGNNLGSWQPEIMDRYTQLIQQDSYNYELANHTMFHEALGSAKHRLPELPATIWNKNHTIQANDDAKIFWVEASADAAGNVGLRDTLRNVVEPINGVFFAGLIMLVGTSVYYLWNARGQTSLLLLVVVCIGYSALLLIIEAQNRYRYIVEPLYCILAAYGLLGMYSAYSGKRNAR